MQQVDDVNRPPARMSRAVNSDGEKQLDLRRLLAIFWGAKWWFVVGAIVGLLGGFLYLAKTPNQYETNALLQILQGSSSPISGISGGLGSAGGFDSQSIAAAEIPIIKSRAVTGAAVKALNLTTTVSRKQTSFFSGFFRQPGNIQVSRFQLTGGPTQAKFNLQVRPDGSYSLTTRDGQQIATGQAGKLLTAAVPSGGRIKLEISKVNLTSPASFNLSKVPWLAEVHQLQSNLVVTEVGQQTGILSLSMTGTDKTFITKVLNAVVNNYVQENINSRSEEASKSLKFLNSQLPKLNKRVNDANQKLADYQEKHQPVELSAQSQALLGQASSLEDKKSTLRLKIAQLREQYTSQYPELKAAEQQYSDINNQISRLQNHINKLPSDQKTLLALQRDAKVSTQLYTSLLNQAQSLQIAKAGTIGNVRVVDPAVVPLSRVSPRPKVVLLVSLILGLLVAALAVLLRLALRHGISDPAELETHTGYSVYGVIPYSQWMTRAIKSRRGRRDEAPLLARDNPSDVVVEALRSLRTSLQFAQMESDSNVVLVTSPAPGVGKSFLSLNLGHLLADTGRRILVVDADMRRGHIHDVFGGTERAHGLSEILSGQQTAADVTRTAPGSSLHVITTGAVPPNPAELLMGSRFRQFVADARQQYDLVLIDAPPVLAVADAGIISNATESPITLLVLKSGTHPWKEIDEAISRFHRQGGHVNGLVLNSYQANREKAHYGYGHYQYAYGSDARKS